MSLLLGAGLCAAGPAAFAQGDAHLQDDTCKVRAASYHLPANWAGAGAVHWNMEAEMAANVCVRQLTLQNEKAGLRAYALSAYEVALPSMTDDAAELSKLLEPMVEHFFAKEFSQITFQRASLAGVPQNIVPILEGRDQLRSSVGHQVRQVAYHLCAVYTAIQPDGTTVEIAVGALVHERSVKEGRRKKPEQTVSFHDVFMIAGQPAAMLQQLPLLRDSLGTPHFNAGWTDEFIKMLAHAYDGMGQVDPKALPLLRQRVQQALASTFHAVLHSLNLQYAEMKGTVAQRPKKKRKG